MKILLFGVTRDILGTESLSIQEEIAESIKTVGALKNYLSESFSGLNRLSTLAVAVNMVYANDNDPVTPNDEIALIPPVSGG
jgi:molybdopterin synthase sulfur carrier subunit